MPPINLIEVGPRDGLQNVKDLLSTDQKLAFIQHLLDKGFMDIEAGSFVRPDRVPSMADSGQIADNLSAFQNRLWYLAPNLKGLEQALAHGVTQLAFFTASSEAFNTNNIGMSVAKSLEVIKECLNHLKSSGYEFILDWSQKPTKPKQVKCRLYISTVIACPYQGQMSPKATLDILEELFPLGFAQTSLGDTIGVGVPHNWQALLSSIDPELIRKNAIALHCHDTYGTALSCVYEGLNHGVRSFDSSIGGLGGCPFAPGATGNLATEDLIYFLHREGLDCGIKTDSLLDVFSPERTGPLLNRSKVALALQNRKLKPS